MTQPPPQSSYPEYINTEFIEQIITNGLHCTGKVEIEEFTVAPLSCGSGENYCSDIYELNLKFRRAAGMEVREEKLIVKSIPKHKLATLKQLNIFHREQYFYERLVPQLETLMSQAGRQWIFGPRLWYATSNPIETLVMQNLTPLGFKLKSRQDGLDAPHSIMALEKLGQYHALTYALTDDKVQFSAIMERYAFGLVNTVSCKSKSFQALFKSQLQSLIEVLQEDADYIDVSNKLLEYCDQFEEKVSASVYPLQGRLNVLNHGDVWVNNLMFRHGSNEAMPLEVRFIDIQLSFYGSLGYDVNYFLNTSVHLATLRDHRQTLIDAYVKSFLETLRLLPYSNVQPTKEQIVQEIHTKEPYGFFVSFAFLPLMCMSENDSQDNSLENLNDPVFAKRKIALMFSPNSRALSTLKYTVKRLLALDLL